MRPTAAEQDRDKMMMGNGSRLLLVGGVLAALGIVVMLIADGLADGIGVALAALAVVPTLAGLGLLGSALVARRARSGRPFA